MKKYLLLLLVALFPYLANIMFENQPDAWKPTQYEDGSNMIFIIITVVYLVFLLLIIISTKMLKKEEEDTKTYAVLILVIKLLQIPFYAIFFIVSFFFTVALTAMFGVGIFLIPVAVGIDYAVLAMTAIPTISCAIIAKKNNQISKGTMVSVIISQFIFCIDVIGAILLLIKLPTKKSLVKLRTQNIEEMQVIPEIQEIPIEECNA